MIKNKKFILSLSILSCSFVGLLSHRLESAHFAAIMATIGTIFCATHTITDISNKGTQ